jgi:hypothetical protein
MLPVVQIVPWPQLPVDGVPQRTLPFLPRNDLLCPIPASLSPPQKGRGKKSLKSTPPSSKSYEKAQRQKADLERKCLREAVGAQGCQGSGCGGAGSPSRWQLPGLAAAAAARHGGRQPSMGPAAGQVRPSVCPSVCLSVCLSVPQWDCSGRRLVLPRALSCPKPKVVLEHPPNICHRYGAYDAGSGGFEDIPRGADGGRGSGQTDGLTDAWGAEQSREQAELEETWYECGRFLKVRTMCRPTDGGGEGLPGLKNARVDGRVDAWAGRCLARQPGGQKDGWRGSQVDRKEQPLLFGTSRQLDRLGDKPWSVCLGSHSVVA